MDRTDSMKPLFGNRDNERLTDEREQESSELELERPAPGKSSRIHGRPQICNTPGKVSLTELLDASLARARRQARLAKALRPHGSVRPLPGVARFTHRRWLEPQRQKRDTREAVTDEFGGLLEKDESPSQPTWISALSSFSDDAGLQDSSSTTKAPASGNEPDALAWEHTLVRPDLHAAPSSGKPRNAPAKTPHNVHSRRSRAQTRRRSPRATIMGSRIMDATSRGRMAAATRPSLSGAPVQRAAAGHATDGDVGSDGAGTPMPKELQAKMETAFNSDFSAVRIHHGSSAGALGARAYTQGTNIHFAPGEYDPGSEKGQSLLGHELAHVVQQSQGRVRSTMQAKGVGINNDAALEREADDMGARAARGETAGGGASTAPRAATSAPVQRKLVIGGDTYKTKNGKDTKSLLPSLAAAPEAPYWKAGWKGLVREMAGDKTNTHNFVDQQALIDHINGAYMVVGTTKRPNFPTESYDLAKAVGSVCQGEDLRDVGLADEDLALPHRFPYADIKSNIMKFASGTEGEADLVRWTNRLSKATQERKDLSTGMDTDDYLPTDYGDRCDRQVTDFETARKALIDEQKAKGPLPDSDPKVHGFVSLANSMHGNIPDLGPHSSVNTRVSDRGHPHFHSDGRASPGTRAMLSMSPTRFGKGLAYDESGQYLVTTDGTLVDPSELDSDTQELVENQHLSTTKITTDDLDMMELDE